MVKPEGVWQILSWPICRNNSPLFLQRISIPFYPVARACIVLLFRFGERGEQFAKPVVCVFIDEMNASVGGANENTSFTEGYNINRRRRCG